MSRLLLVSAVVAFSALLWNAPAAALTSWTVALATPDEGSTNVVTVDGVRLGTGDNRAASAGAALRTGFALYSHTLATPANTFAGVVRASVPAGAELAIDIRGHVTDDAGERWTEWVELRPEAPGALPVTVADIEVRLTLSSPDRVASPQVMALSVIPSTVSDQERGSSAAATVGLTYRVFATREGLVGGTTANGHRIVARDHFVALPSRRGLSAKARGEYTVRVCAANGRCAWAPVWDVGPWNTKDDYWAAPEVRQEWRDLPQGRPASQAAYQDGYNNGKDQFGRKVLNPAGIDLADGTFWDALTLKDNAWVTVSYLWTGSGPAGYVRTRGDTLNVRTGPTSQTPVVGMAANYAQVRTECAVAGESVAGTQGTTDLWYRLAAGMFVSAAYVSGGGAVPAC